MALMLPVGRISYSDIDLIVVSSGYDKAITPTM
jgi:hypothetical protein